MRYMMLVYSKETPAGEIDPEAMRAVAEQHHRVMESASSRGVLRGAAPLKPTGTATTVRKSGGEPVISDGPFAETKEQLAGYYILECRNLDEALEWAQQIPTGCYGGEGCIEVRPILEIARPAAE